ncbi:flavin monoamine oxidase family protein [Candidatus Clostridium stratigraminis]|uniref:Flavin monoamine oxidase family protein n=1 Tax=Candidatus Clostridium stratigraminis TaxID=3381661 RepID=A0ABW8T784_9CLOT
MAVNGIQPVPINPTNLERHEMLKNSLKKAGRSEDFNNIIGLLSPPKDILNYCPPGKLKGVKIGIIGGGLAGLSSAFELRKLGADITIFDALTDRIGGRVYTHYFDKEKKYYGELGPIRIPVAHETTWHYINKFKLNTMPFIQDNPNAFVYVHNTRIRNDSAGKNVTEKLYPKYNLTEREKNISWPTLYNYAINEPLNRLPENIRKEILKILPKYSVPYSELIKMSFRQVFEMLGLSEDAINLISSVDSLTGSFLYISHAELLSEMYPLDFSTLYRVDGGNSNLPLSFYKSLTSAHPSEYEDIPNHLLGKVIIKSGHYVKGIYRQDKNKVIIKYRTRQISQDLIESFDYIICAIPFSTLRLVDIKPLFSNRKMQAIREFNYVNSQRTLLLCNKRFWEEDTDYGRINGGVSNTDLPIQNVIYPSDHALYDEANKYLSKEPGVIVASYNLNLDAVRLENANKERRKEIIKDQIEEVHGLPKGYLDHIVEKYRTINWNNEQWFRGAFSMTMPGQKSIFLHDILKPEFDNKVFFAGEHASATHAWMQGALYSGKLAANTLAYNSNFQK